MWVFTQSCGFLIKTRAGKLQGSVNMWEGYSYTCATCKNTSLFCLVLRPGLFHQTKLKLQTPKKNFCNMDKTCSMYSHNQEDGFCCWFEMLPWNCRKWCEAVNCISSQLFDASEVTCIITPPPQKCCEDNRSSVTGAPLQGWMQGC